MLFAVIAIIVETLCAYAIPVFGIYISYYIKDISVISKDDPLTVHTAAAMAPKPKHVLTISYYSKALLFKALKQKNIWEVVLHELREDGRYYLLCELFGLHTSSVVRSFRTILESYHNLYQESVIIDGRWCKL